MKFTNVIRKTPHAAAVRSGRDERKIEPALRRASYHLANAPLAVMEIDHERRITSWSKRCEELFGWREVEAIGRRFTELGIAHPDDAAEVEKVFQGFDDPSADSCEAFTRNVTKDGSVVYVQWFCSLLRDADGMLVSNLAFALDRTAEIEARNALKAERDMFVAGPTMVFRWRNEEGWPVEYASENVESILGYEPRQLIDDERGYAGFIHPDDLACVYASAKRAEEHDGVRHFDVQPYRMRTAAGTFRWLKAHAMPLRSPEGHVSHFMGYVTDVTTNHLLQERIRTQEERLRYVIEGTNVGTWEWNPQTNETVFDERWAEIIGYTLDELAPVSIQTWIDHTHPDDLAQSNEMLKKHFEGELDHYACEARMKHKDGRWVWVLDRGKVVEWSASGEPVRVAGTHADITKRKAAEQALIEANEELLRSNAELEQYAYVASHDLQEPLRMVAGFTQLLERKYGDVLDDEGREFVKYAVDGATRMQKLISDLLAYSRVGRRDLQLELVDMNAVADEVLQSLEPAINECSAVIRIDELPAVKGDRIQLGQLLQNLIANALKYRGKKSPEVRLTVEDSDDGEYTFCVRDNGIGFDRKFAERVFEIFQRLHTRSEYPGTGIGLAICKRIVERHQGRIWVETTPGDGSSFYFSLQRD